MAWLKYLAAARLDQPESAVTFAGIPTIEGKSIQHLRDSIDLLPATLESPRGMNAMLATMFRCTTVFLFALNHWTPGYAQDATATLAGGETGKISFRSANRSTGLDALYKGKAKFDEVIFGELSLPNGSGRFPAMVVMHGSSGVEMGTSREWAALLRQMGIATFIVDSFTSRGIRGTGTDQAQITYTASGIDGLKALQLLATHPRIDVARIGIIGFSRGGVASQEASFERFRAAVIPDRLKFALHIALYGGCTQYGTTTGSPVLHLTGESDGMMSIEQCRKTTRLNSVRGGNVRLVTYPGALHGFDRENQKRTYMANNQSWKMCRFETDMDSLAAQLPGNGSASVSEVAAYRKSCMTTGLDYGGDRVAAAKAREEAKRFVKQGFGL